MAASDYATLLTALGPKSASGFIQALEERGVYVIDSMEDPTDLNAGNILSLLFNGVLFWYNPADSTSVHDGVTIIVTAEGRRYKSDQYSGVSSRWVAVKDKSLTAPPGSPALGDTYIVAAGGTGAWAAKDKKFATWTARGWVFLTPKAFDYAYVIDEALIYHYSAGGVWTSGIPAITIADSSLSHNKFNYFKLGMVSVENQTTNAPPGSPTNGVAYIIGGSPSGVWIGHALEVVIREAGAWVYYIPYEGAEVHDKTLDSYAKFNGATWEVPPQVVWKFIENRVISNDATVDFTNLGAYKALRIIISNLVPEFNQRSVQVQVSSDNGSTYISTASYPSATSWALTVAPGVTAIGNLASNGGFSAEVLISEWNIAQKTRIFSQASWGDQISALNILSLNTWQTSILSMNALRFFALTSGNLVSGNIIIEGLEL